MVRSCLILTTVMILVLSATTQLIAAPDVWDSRLDLFCGLQLVDVESQVSSGQGYWRLKSAVFEDENESGGTNHVYVRAHDINGNPIVDQKFFQTWPYNQQSIDESSCNESNWACAYTKSGGIDDYYGNVPMAGGCLSCNGSYNAFISETSSPAGLIGLSDKLVGMWMYNPNGTLCNAHVSFRLIFQWTISGGGSSSPTIDLSPATLTPLVTEGSSPANDTFTVSNSGSGTLNYTISDDASWLSVSPASGSSTGEADTVTVTYATSSLDEGTYNATITVSDPNATNNPQTIAVTLTVLGGSSSPTIDLSPATLSPSVTEGSSPGNNTFTVGNSGGDTLNYTISDDASWLSVSPTSGTSTGEVDTITVSYSTSGLSVGTHNATITVSDSNASNNPQTIAVTLTVYAAGGQTEPLRVRRNFMGMHNLKNGGVAPFQIGLDWTKTLGGGGFVLDWVTDYDPDAPDHWIYEVMSRDMVPCVRVQHCQGDYPDECAPNVGYKVGVVDQILQWKVANPQYADRLVYVQLWNEPGDSRDYVPMDDFADFMVAAYNSIHNKVNEYVAAYPSLGLEDTIQVMTPGQNDGWDTAFNHNPQAKFSFDVWATHPYPDMTPPWWNIHDGDLPPYWLKTIDSYIQDIDECAKTHNGVPGRRGFPVMITETNYGHYVGVSKDGWPRLRQEDRGAYTTDAYFNRWYKWPEIIAVHPFILNNNAWPAFEFVHSWSTQDIEEPFGVLEPANPLPVYSELKAAREDIESQGLLAPARLSPYRGAVGTITGLVTQAGTENPLPYASVATDGYEFGHVALYDGIYEIHNVPVGAYTLSCEKGTSYVAESQQITVTEGQTTTANFSLTYIGKSIHVLYQISDQDGGCSGSCSNLNAVDHWQSFMTGSDTGYIKFASCMPYIDDITMRLSIHEGSPSGPQVGVSITVYNPTGAGAQVIGYEWPDGQEPVVQPNTMYWLHFQRDDGQATYCYASESNPYPAGSSSSSSGVDFYGAIYGLTQELNLVTGTIAGTVTDASSNALSGATVSFSPGGTSTTTASDGSYTMNNVSVGTYSVTASKSGYTSQTVSNQTVSEDTTTTVNFSLSTLPPSIALSTLTLNPTTDEGSNADADSFTIQNSGSGTLNYSISDDASWLSVSPASGSSTGEADTITITYSTSGLAAGTHNATITASDSSATNNPQTIVVTLTVNVTNGATVVAEDFNSMPSWSSSYDAGWGSSATWSIVGGGQSGNALQASRTSGGSSGNVKVYSIDANSDYTISVYIKCPTFGSSYWAEGAYRLGSYTAQDFDANSGSWSMIKKFSSSGTNGNGNTWVEYSDTFNSGSNTQISVGFKLGSSGGAGPMVMWDTLRVTGEGGTPTPTIELSTSSLSASVGEGSDAFDQTFTVANNGDGTLNYSISDNASWLSVSPASGTSTGEADTITVSYSTSGLAVGTHNGTITVSDPSATNDPQTIAVTVTINALPAAISLSTSSLSATTDEGTNAAADSFTVQNVGGSTALDYSIGDDMSWLSVSPASGTSTGEADTITVTYSTSSLAAGSHNGTITVSDPNAINNPQTIAVSLTVNAVSGPAVAEDFDSMPSWTSAYDAGWGSSATWSIASGGQSGTALQAARSSGGSSSKVKVYDIDTNTDYTISVYIKCPNFGSSYWAECAYRLGNHSGQDFDSNSGAWTMVKKFSTSTTNGNGNTWTQYSLNFNSGSNTQISVGFKLGSSGGAGPTVQWDTLRVE